jgi:hypothetical protein
VRIPSEGGQAFRRNADTDSNGTVSSCCPLLSPGLPSLDMRPKRRTLIKTNPPPKELD